MAAPRSWAPLTSMIASALFLVGLIAGVAVWRRVGSAGHARGTVIVDGTSFGTFTFTVDACTKVRMADADSFGVDLRGSDGNVLRLTSDVRDAQLWLTTARAAGGAIPIGRRDCSEWKVNLFAEDVSLVPVGGDASVTCSVGGGRLNAAVFFEHCRP